MASVLRRWGGPGVLFLVGLSFDVSDFFGSSVVAYTVWAVAGTWVLYLAWPWLIKGDTGHGHAEDEREVGMGERRNEEPEEWRGYVDNRSVTSHGQTGGQTAFTIFNQGPQPREVNRAAADILVTELRKHPPEQFQISWMQDAESGELGAVLRDLLRQGGWQMTMEASGAMLSGGPPRGVIIETTADSEALSTLVEWLRRGGMNPQINRGEPRFDILTRGLFGDSPPPPVHIVVGVLPR